MIRSIAILSCSLVLGCGGGGLPVMPFDSLSETATPDNSNENTDTAFVNQDHSFEWSTKQEFRNVLTLPDGDLDPVSSPAWICQVDYEPSFIFRFKSSPIDSDSGGLIGTAYTFENTISADMVLAGSFDYAITESHKININNRVWDFKKLQQMVQRKGDPSVLFYTRNLTALVDGIEARCDVICNTAPGFCIFNSEDQSSWLIRGANL